ncbi:MAG: type II 3-dehydroquinate dehydratase [Deltaproteobacteria bacterium]|nr:MAG: type II 3-dehydroquinate dehydratase [Deltaproteobacteria bacterium]
MKILVIHGPNLNLLGTREPEVYGSLTMADINDSLRLLAKELGVEVEFFQSNFEGELVEAVQKAASAYDGIVINPAAFTHTSVALRDAFSGVGIPFVEVHISNVHAREHFRRTSYLSDIAIGVIAGLGIESYLGGFKGLVGKLRE